MEPGSSLPHSQRPATCPYPEPAEFPFRSWCRTKESVPVRGFVGCFVTSYFFYGELLAPRPTPKLEDHPLSAVRVCLFHIFAATLHNWRPFVHPQPEDAPCRGDRDPLNKGKCQHAYKNTLSQRFHFQYFL
jgi:hypothetical protein